MHKQGLKLVRKYGNQIQKQVIFYCAIANSNKLDKPLAYTVAKLCLFSDKSIASLATM